MQKIEDTKGDLPEFFVANTVRTQKITTLALGRLVSNYNLSDSIGYIKRGKRGVRDIARENNTGEVRKRGRVVGGVLERGRERQRDYEHEV